MRWRHLSLIIGLLFAAPVGGQTTQPSDPQMSWSSVVERFSTALCANDAGALLPLLGEDVSIECLDGHSADAVRLLARTRGATLIGGKAYFGPSGTLATDLAEQIKVAEVSAAFKNWMVPRDPAQAKRANLTAARWLNETLGARSIDPVAVLVFVSDPASSESAGPREKSALFVLIRGACAGTSPGVCRIAFGDARNLSR